jgi:hypothetical protein
MTTYDYSRVIARAKALIEKYGGTVYLKVPVDGAVDGGTGQTTYNQLTIPVKGIVSAFSKSEVNDDSILEDDRQVLIATENGEPLVNNLIEVADEEFRILAVEAINPNAAEPIIFKLHIRSTTVSEDLSGYVTTLKGLEVGDVIIDPSNIREWPQWIKVANDHHASGITTLVERYPHFGYVFSDEAPTLDRWIDTQLYTYMNEEYRYNLSYDFSQILSSVLLETNEYFVSEDITCLSREEMDGEYAIGSSGKQIPYFDSQLRRIALDDVEFANVNYWTRDYYGSDTAIMVTIKGTLAAYSITEDLAIRAMVFVEDAQQVKLNDDGETYSFIY